MSLILNLSMLGARPTGLGVYAGHCAKALRESFECQVIAGSADRGADVKYRAPESVAIGGGKLAAIRRQLWMRSIRLPEDAIVYSPTHHGIPGVKNQIITIHDLICLRFPGQHVPQYLFFKYALPGLLKQCIAVFTVSEATRADVARTYGFPLDRIVVVPNGVDRGRFQAAENINCESPYLLMVGARYPHKNVDEVILNSRLWAHKYRLIVTSCGGAYRKQIEALARNQGVTERVEFRDYIPAEGLIRLYQECAALIYPSKWEGFGIPPLEALACGRPVILSDIPAHREVVGEAGWFVSLGDGAGWRAAFERLGRADETLPEFHAQRSKVLERWTWPKSAEQLKDALLRTAPALRDCLRASNADVSACHEESVAC